MESYGEIGRVPVNLYIMIYGCDDAFFKQKEPWSCKPWLENFAEFTTLR